MKWPSPYLKMRVLGAIEMAEGETIRERIKNTADLTFTDEEGNARRFTWRTISTWYYRYKNHGVTGVSIKDRSDKGKTRKISPEELMEAINQELHGYGVEAIRDESDIPVADYINFGDPYVPTILRDLQTDEFLLCCWGDWLEDWENDNNIERE